MIKKKSIYLLIGVVIALVFLSIIGYMLANRNTIIDNETASFNRAMTTFTIRWGEVTNGLQLSLTVSPSVVKFKSLQSGTEKLIINLRARNLTDKDFDFDASLPVGNGSELHFIYPDGNTVELAFWDDELHHLIIPSGEASLGMYAEGVNLGEFDLTQFLGKWESRPRVESIVPERILKSMKRGTYQVTWNIGPSVSNTVGFRVE